MEKSVESFRFRITNVQWTYAVTPESVINSADVNGEQRQRNAKQIVGEKTVIIELWPAAENMVKRWEAHADLEAYEKSTDDHFVNKMCVNL